MPSLEIRGIPSDASPEARAICVGRLHKAVSDLVKNVAVETVDIQILSPEMNGHVVSGDKHHQPSHLTDFRAAAPRFTQDDIVISEAVSKQIEKWILPAVHAAALSEWSLSEAPALTLHGPPGVGKTSLAHVLAAMLGKKILAVKGSAFESMYLGESAKNVLNFFGEARRQNAIPVVDEADSILFKRSGGLQSSDNALRSIQADLLGEIEKCNGLAIFTTNRLSDYDGAFLNRMITVHMPSPDAPWRSRVWQARLRHAPVAKDVSWDELADWSDGMEGRNIAQAAMLAGALANSVGADCIRRTDLREALNLVGTRFEDKPKP
jgi:ATP-dependent 26S proteasome regulatory subunit